MKKYTVMLVLACLTNVIVAQDYFHIRMDGNLPKGYFLDKIYESSKTILLNEPSANLLSHTDSLPFNFKFYGNDVRYFKVSDNGYLSFDTSETISKLPSSNLPNNCIFGFWDDFKLQKLPNPNEGVGIQVYSYTVGVAPNRQHIVQFFGLSLNEDMFDGPITNSSIYAFAIIFHEKGEGRFDLVYTPFGNKLSKGAIGCSNFDGSKSKLLNDSVAFLPFQFSFDTRNFLVYQFYYGLQHQTDLKIQTLTSNNVYPVNAIVNFSGTMINVGKSAVNSMILNYSVNATDTIQHVLNGLNILPNGESKYNFNHPISWTSGPAGSLNKLNFWVSMSNGSIDGDSLNSHYSKVILRNSNSYTANKNVVIEEATGAWCGYCPDASVHIDSAYHKFGRRLIPVSYHNEDSMSNPESEAFLSKYFTSYPDAIIDRKLELGSTHTWQGIIAEQFNAKSPVAIQIDMKSFNASTREIKFQVTAVFSDYWYGDLRLGSIVTEDDVRGGETPNMWSQNNYYSKYKNGGAAGPNHPLYNELEFMKGFKHQNVFKANPGGQDGIDGVFPKYILPNSSYSRTFSYFLPEMEFVSYTSENNTPYCSTIDEIGMNEGRNVPAKINLIGFVSILDSLRGEYSILNANSVRLWNLTDINYFNADESVFVYPNPANYGAFSVDFFVSNPEPISLTVTDILGNVIYNESYSQLENGRNVIALKTLDWASGVYFVNISSQQLNFSTKLVVQN